MDRIKFNKSLASIVKSREIQRNVIKERSLEQAGFSNYAEKLGAPFIEAKDNITIIITDKYL